jgi:hypothetical protein
MVYLSYFKQMLEEYLKILHDLIHDHTPIDTVDKLWLQKTNKNSKTNGISFDPENGGSIFLLKLLSRYKTILYGHNLNNQNLKTL